MSDLTRRHAFTLLIDPATQKQASINKRISLDLVFLSPQLQQLDHKADFILSRLFDVLHDRYIASGSRSTLHLLPPSIEKCIETAPDETARARLVCDWIASMTDRFAFRTYRRLFDADFGSITDFV